MSLALAGFDLRAAHSWHKLIVHHKVDCVNHKVAANATRPQAIPATPLYSPMVQVWIFCCVRLCGCNAFVGKPGDPFSKTVVGPSGPPHDRHGESRAREHAFGAARIDVATTARAPTAT